MNDNLNICIELAKAESEKNVINILKKAGYWDNPEAWQNYGNNENNYATIGNQQSAPDAALVEKIINSVDAILMRECLERNIDPEGADAPQTTKEATEQFFYIKEGILSKMDRAKRSEIAQDIMVVATGKKSNPCFSIIDKGEGQTPRKMPDTFLSLGKSNKLRIPFVQGKFNMGGTGSLLFCGKKNLQLIISRRDPDIVRHEGDDGTSAYWGFTVIRREDPVGGMRSSTYRYLAPNKEILTFKANFLSLLPLEYPKAYGKLLQWGSFVKLYEYRLRGLRSLIKLDLYYRLATLLPNIALPVLLYERRRGYRANSYHTVLSGLSVRLDENEHKIIEPGFPSSGILKTKGQEIRIQTYVFKRGKRKHYAKDEGVIFTVNGQAHGFIPKSFFARKAVGMSYLEDSILILADCSDLGARVREDLFMNSRDRLRSGEVKREIERNLKLLVKNHKGLRELREKRRREDIKGKIRDEKPFIRIIENVIERSPTLSKLFIEGDKITNPFNLTNAGTKKIFKGKKFPTYFILKKEFTKERPKYCPINQRFRVQFETDAENDYFTRETDRGKFDLYFDDGTTITNPTLNLWNGIATLTVSLPKNVKEGNIVGYQVKVDDIQRKNPIAQNFYVLVAPFAKKSPGGNGERAKPSGKRGKGKREKPARLALPSIIPVYQNEWDRYQFNRETALTVKCSSEGSYDFYVNMDNCHLLAEIKGRKNADSELLRAQYESGMVLIGLSLLREFEEKDNSSEEESVYEKISKITGAIAPILLPMITGLNELNA